MMSCLGPYAKYSSCLYPTGKESLEEAEVLMMDLYCKEAKLKDGQDVLDLGCGTNPPNIPLFFSPLYSNETHNGRYDRVGKFVSVFGSGALCLDVIGCSL